MLKIGPGRAWSSRLKWPRSSPSSAKSLDPSLSCSAVLHLSRSLNLVSSAPKHLDLPTFGPLSGLSRVGVDEKIYVAMSGGVDSSTVAALLTRQLGKARVRGVFMNNWSSQARCQESSWRSVQDLCQQIGIECHRVDLERDYWSEVFEPMLEAYQRGLTPNPDVSCNRYIKFGQLIAHLKKYDPHFSWIATGHYAGVYESREHGTPLVHRAEYMPKDQSYYLATVASDVLSHALFPLAHMTKPAVRDWARKLGLVDVASKPDSQGLCFVEQQHEVGPRGFRKFLAEYLEENPGPVVLAENTDVVVGEHMGLWTHTVGQRASVPMPQNSPHTRGQWFVVAKDIERNALIIDRGVNCDRLFVNSVSSSDFVWHARPGSAANLYVQYRSLQVPWKVSGIAEDGPVSFTFTDRRRAVAPGQYIVVYENNAVIGAGTITSTATIESTASL